MTAPDNSPTYGRPPALGVSLARGLAAVAALTVMEAAWFACRFIVPR